MIDLVKYTNELFKTVQTVQKLSDDICPDCFMKMKEIDRNEDVKVYPVSGPEVIRTNWIKYWCPLCGKEITIY